MAALGCVQDNESITHHTESREEGVPFPSNSDNCIRTCVHTSRFLHHCYSLQHLPQQNPFLHHCYSLQHLPRHQPNTKPCVSTVAIQRVLDPLAGIRPTSVSWHRRQASIIPDVGQSRLRCSTR
ncbi:hypothetical protein B296_00053265 [Ensete ventricosum]|uniref:Uncharacterized protein n=1 Tax=Ensete ventricosum TaxID=4639 RepID=A0A426Y907_ENSVE|nr:hypothetical protein B296_00053265 [Ensete ventricosum]